MFKLLLCLAAVSNAQLACYICTTALYQECQNINSEASVWAKYGTICPIPPAGQHAFCQTTSTFNGNGELTKLTRSCGQADQNVTYTKSCTEIFL